MAPSWRSSIAPSRKIRPLLSSRQCHCPSPFFIMTSLARCPGRFPFDQQQPLRWNSECTIKASASAALSAALSRMVRTLFGHKVKSSSQTRRWKILHRSRSLCRQSDLISWVLDASGIALGINPVPQYGTVPNTICQRCQLFVPTYRERGDILAPGFTRVGVSHTGLCVQSAILHCRRPQASACR